MCLNHGRPGMPSGLSQLRSTCMAPWLMVAASFGSIAPEAKARVAESSRRLLATSKSSMAESTGVMSSTPGTVLFPVRARCSLEGPEKRAESEFPAEAQVAQEGAGSFDSAAASLCEPATPLRMTDLLLFFA